MDYEIKTYKRSEDGLAPPELRNVHPLGKSPVVIISSPAQEQPLVLAETGAIVGKFFLNLMDCFVPAGIIVIALSLSLSLSLNQGAKLTNKPQSTSQSDGASS